MTQKKFYMQYFSKKKDKKIKAPLSWHSIISTWFYIGMLPASGTFGSIAAYPIFYYIEMRSYPSITNKMMLLLVILILSIIGFFAIKQFQKMTNTCDHRYIVIDEVIGQLLTLYITSDYILFFSYFVVPTNHLYNTVISFSVALVTFRYFDIKKPLIIDYINTKCKNAFGVIFDDILASIFASITIYIIYMTLTILMTLLH